MKKLAIKKMGRKFQKTIIVIIAVIVILSLILPWFAKGL